MNKVILSGNLCREIELKQTQGSRGVVTNCIAVQRDFKNVNGEYESDFINIVVWGNQAEYLSKYAAKGDRVELVGRWAVRTYEDLNGENKTVNECVVEQIKAFSRQKDEKKEEKKEKPTLEEMRDELDLPF